MTRIAVVFLAALGLSGAAWAQGAPESAPAAAGASLLTTASPTQLSADLAQRAAEAGELTLIDLRTPREWAMTGSPAEAERIDMQAPDFGERLLALIQRNPAKPIALICATGGRSGYVFAALKKRGFERVYNIAEGMMGSKAGPGWLARGLPLVRPR